ncbi:[NiFe]-hydrogenase assembly chaperone HybE [Polaromonas hydrogenivorans]|uniref:[NiFe]-hydrogenase assembly chaperone HybE n=1 Tax=Polaromonas hydrogenivorans TaxID=335476 RepID=A0AAU7LX47_9BURK
MRSTDSPVLSLRVKALAALYQHIASTRMQGIPLLNPAVQVEAVGFELVQADASDPEAPASGVGVLITPWFMNLVWLPLRRLDLAKQVGGKVPRYVGRECFEFIAAHEDDFGSYEACSLFSPVFEFENHQAAVATAQAVLDMLRQPASTAAQAALPQAPARRAFLFGRSSNVAAPGRGEAGRG